MSTPEDLSADWERALAGDEPAALSRFVRRLTPIVQARVARKLLLYRDRAGAQRDVRQEVEDLTQEVFLALFADEARVLRDWRPERGLSLANFVGLVAERQALSVLRSRRRSPWNADPVLDEELDADTELATPEREVVSRDTLDRLLERLAAELTPLGLRIFDLLLVEAVPLEEAMAETGLTSDALYAWRSRLRKRARRLLADLSENRAGAQTSVGDPGR
jgi:RNA polymerase sigma-70 factor (ECF subfamily)